MSVVTVGKQRTPAAGKGGAPLRWNPQPDDVQRSVAQLVLALMLHFTHDVAGHSAAVKSGAWAESPDFVFCLQPLRELAGKTLAILGMGAIGSAVRDVATALGMRVLASTLRQSLSS